MDAIARAFAREIKRQGYTCYACSIMPDHVDALIRKWEPSVAQRLAPAGA